MTDPAPEAAKLLPCPKCGSKAVRVIYDFEGGYGVRCKERCQGVDAHSWVSQEKADIQWNTPPQPAPTQDEPDFAVLAHECFMPNIPVEKQMQIFGEQMYRLGAASRPKVEDAEVARAIAYFRDAAAHDIFAHSATEAADMLFRINDRMKAAEARAGELEAELAKADAVVNAMTGSDFYTYSARGERQRNLTEWYEQAVARHAARQQQKDAK